MVNIMLKRTPFITTLFLLFLTSTFVQQRNALAQVGTTLSFKNLNLNDNIAVVAWTGYNNRDDFRESPALMKKLFCSLDGAFRVKPDNYIVMDVQFKEGMSVDFKQAVNKIKDKKDPVLIVALASHGEKGSICSQTIPDISYDEILDMLFQNSFEINKDITVMLFINACYSGSIIPILQKKLSCDESTKENCTFEGTDGGHYRHKVSVYTAAPSDEVAWGNQFFKTLNNVTKKENCKDKASCGLNDSGVLTFMSSKNDDDYVAWSSFAGKNENLLALNNDRKGSQTVIKYFINNLKNHKDPKVRASAADNLDDTLAKGNETVIVALIDALKNDKDDKVRASATKSLGKIALQGNETVIVALIDALKNDKDDKVRASAAKSLGKIALQGDKTAIETLSYALKDNYVCNDAIEALDSISPKENKVATEALSYVLKNNKDSAVRYDAANVLNHIVGLVMKRHFRL